MAAEGRCVEYSGPRGPSCLQGGRACSRRHFRGRTHSTGWWPQCGRWGRNVPKSERGSRSVVSDSLRPHDYSPWNSPGQITRVGILFLLQGILLTQRSNSALPHCRQTLYQLSHRESPRILMWVGSLSLLQQIFPTQELYWGLLYCRRTLYQLSYSSKVTSKTLGAWRCSHGEGDQISGGKIKGFW